MSLLRLSEQLVLLVTVVALQQCKTSDCFTLLAFCIVPFKTMRVSCQ